MIISESTCQWESCVKFYSHFCGCIFNLVLTVCVPVLNIIGSVSVIACPYNGLCQLHCASTVADICM